MRLVLLIHGINTGRTDPSWPYWFKGYLHSHYEGIVTHVEHYKAGPRPLRNVFWKNKKEAQILGDRLRLLHSQANYDRIDVVGHSNGCDIADELMKRADALPLDSAVLISGACKSDPAKTNFSRLPGQAYAYYGTRDKLIKFTGWFPGLYGGLGATGWRRNDLNVGPHLIDDRGQRAEPWVSRRWDYGHSDPWKAANRERTFACIAKDLQF